MNKIAEKLTDYIIAKNIIEEKNRELYKFGFLVALEKFIFLIICLTIAIYMNSFLMALIFFIIFIPLRSFAGGFHFDSYKLCFFMSCLVYIFCVFFGDFFCFSRMTYMIVVFLLELGIYYIYPVDHVNRMVDDEENIYFKKKLFFWLGIDIALAIVCMTFDNIEYLQVIVNAIFVVFITMILGKVRIAI